VRLATLRTGTSREPSTEVVRVDDSSVTVVPGAADVGELLRDPSWRERAAAAGGTTRALADVAPQQWAPVVPRPAKIVCVGLNYAHHIREMGRELPEHPTLFAKYPEALIGPYDPIVLPAAAPDAVDWEGELAVVIGATARHLDPSAAAGAIAGYAVLNDVTMRDYQYRTPEWLQGKTFEATTPFGPYLVTGDAFAHGDLRTVVDDETVQEASTSDLVFPAAELVAYISTILTLQPGDVIATGTPGGVGHARKPPRYLRTGNVLHTSISGLGEQRNAVVEEC
jgi:acylpyruvate hydrolase